MALENFQYTKTWESADDFPTIETDEDKVRADIQCLYDEIAAGLNALITALNAGGIDTSQLADGSVTTAKLADGAVTLAKLAEDAKLVFICSESTGNADILAAVAAGKLPVYRSNDGRDYVYLKKNSSNQAEFFAVDGDTIYTVTRGAFNWTVTMYAPYILPNTGIPSTDLASDVQTSLGKADSAYQKPGSGIPKTDLSSGVTTEINKGLSAYQSLLNGVQKDQLASDVQASLGKADTAYQKPAGGIPVGDLASDAVPKNTVWVTYGDTSAFDKIDAAYGEKPVAVRYNDRVYSLATANREGFDELLVITSYTLSCIDEDGMLYYVKCTMGSPDTWTNGSIDLTSGGGTSDYDDLTDKPSINGVTLSGNKTTSDLKLDQVFNATYGTTTVAEIDAAFTAGKEIQVSDGTNVFYLYEKVSSTEYWFSCAASTGNYLAVCDSNGWGTSGIDIPLPQTSGTPAALGTAARGTATTYSRSDHVHDMPSASDVGAVAVSQGVAHAGEFVVVGSDGNITTVTMTAWQGGSY